VLPGIKTAECTLLDFESFPAARPDFLVSPYAEVLALLEQRKLGTVPVTVVPAGRQRRHCGWSARPAGMSGGCGDASYLATGPSLIQWGALGETGLVARDDDAFAARGGGGGLWLVDRPDRRDRAGATPVAAGPDAAVCTVPAAPPSAAAMSSNPPVASALLCGPAASAMSPNPDRAVAVPDSKVSPSIEKAMFGSNNGPEPAAPAAAAHRSSVAAPSARPVPPRYPVRSPARRPGRCG
jgi:hypothetical protein